MKTLNIKTGDIVVVIAGKDAKKQGKVLKTFPETNRVIVEGVNIISRHQKARKAQEKSEIVKKEGAIDVSNVMVICPTCGKATRVKHIINKDGKSVRVCKCGAILDKAFVKDAKKAKKADKAEAVKQEENVEAKTEKVEKAETKKVAAKKPAAKKVVATSASKNKTNSAAVRKNSQRGV